MSKEEFLKHLYKMHQYTNILVLAIAAGIAPQGYGDQAIGLIAIYLLGTVLVTKES